MVRESRACEEARGTNKRNPFCLMNVVSNFEKVCELTFRAAGGAGNLSVDSEVDPVEGKNNCIKVVCSM
jgi:hypothetical protein